MKDLKMETLAKIMAGEEPATFEKLKPMLRPEGITNGLMKFDPEKCTGCGLCIENCPYRCLEMGKDKVPVPKSDVTCFSCFNCMIPCPEGAVSIVQTFSIREGFFDTDFPATKMPLEPKDAEGKPAEWNEVERIIMNRRSVRNFKKTPVPEPLIRRVLEAGRFAPSGGNHQPWKFVVVTDPGFIAELEGACQAVWAGLQGMMVNDEQVMNLVKTIPTGIWDPRVQQGMKCIARKDLPVFLSAPVVIFLGGNKKMTGSEMEAGIAGQNMNLAAVSLGLGFCWNNFGMGVNYVPELMAKLGYDDTWTVQTTACMGYPRFKQEGVVPRHFRPITWFRSGSKKPEIDK